MNMNQQLAKTILHSACLGLIAAILLACGIAASEQTAAS